MRHGRMNIVSKHADFLKVVTKLNDRSRLEHSVRVDDELPVHQRIDITLDEEEIGTAFDWEETLPGNVNTMGILKMLDCRSRRCLELDGIL